MILNCVAIDDEPPALRLLNRFIAQTPFLFLAASFSNAVEAIEFINSSKVDLLFLDIRMPHLSGIELARLLSEKPEEDKPGIVFITAYDQYALEGYKFDVMDYILKPFNYKDFLRAANKALTWQELKTNAAKNHSGKDEEIYLRVNHQTVKLNCNDITYIEGLKDYAKIHLVNENKSLLSLITLKALEGRLPPGKFMRVHKSFIVRLDKITAVTRNAVNIGAITIPVSVPFRDDFVNFASNWQ